jgi:hypothetical protein
MRLTTLCRPLLAAVLVLALLPAVARARAEIEDRRVVTGQLADGETLDVEVDRGRIEIATWSRDEARIETFLNVEAGGKTRAREVLDGVRIDVRREADRLVVRTEEPQYMHGGMFGWLTGEEARLVVHHRITLPDGAHAVLATRRGSIGVLRAGGALTASTVHGHIELAGVVGPVDASTTHGGIDAELVASPRADLELSTVHGSVNLRLGPTVRLSVDASSVNGRVLVAEELGLESDDQRSLTGELGGGGAGLEIRTVNGAIRLLPVEEETETTQPTPDAAP